MPLWILPWIMKSGWKYILGALVLAAVIGSYAYAHHAGLVEGKKIVQQQWDQTEAERQKESIKTEHVASQTVAAIAQTTSQKIGSIQTQIRTVKEYVDISPPPVGCFVHFHVERVYDASGTGDNAYLADAGHDTIGTAQDVPCAEAETIFAENNEAFRANAAQLAGLQEAYAKLEALYAGAVKTTAISP